jgi:hypothetical protein
MLTFVLTTSADFSSSYRYIKYLDLLPVFIFDFGSKTESTWWKIYTFGVGTYFIFVI